MLHIVVAAGQKIPQTGKQKPKVQLKFNYIKVAAPVAVHPHTPDIYIYIYIHIAITFNKFSIWVCHFLPPSPLRWHFSMGDQQMDAANYGCKKSNGGVEQKMVNATHSRTQNGVVGGRTTGPWVSMACRKLRSFTANAANWNNLHVVHVLAGGCNVNASHQRVKLACNPGVLARLLIPGFSSNHEFWFSPSDRRVCCRNSEQKKKKKMYLSNNNEVTNRACPCPVSPASPASRENLSVTASADYGAFVEHLSLIFSLLWPTICCTWAATAV